jgi:hypothetical protein
MIAANLTLSPNCYSRSIVAAGCSYALLPYRRHLAGAFASRVAQALLPVRFPPPDPNPFVSNTLETCTILVHFSSAKLFRINTCTSVSKQRTLSPFRMNTYAKPPGGVPRPYIRRCAPILPILGLDRPRNGRAQLRQKTPSEKPPQLVRYVSFALHPSPFFPLWPKVDLSLS